MPLGASLVCFFSTSSRTTLITQLDLPCYELMPATQSNMQLECPIAVESNLNQINETNSMLHSLQQNVTKTQANDPDQISVQSFSRKENNRN